MPPGDVISLQPNIEVPQHPSESRAAVNHLQVRKVKKKVGSAGSTETKRVRLSAEEDHKYL